MPTARKSTAAKRTADKPDDRNSDFVDTKFYNPHAANGRPPGVYLDEVERNAAEVVRAKQEDREPDFDNAPATAGTPLTTSDNLPTPSVRNGEVHPNSDETALEPFVTLPVSVGGAPVEPDEEDEEDKDETPNEDNNDLSSLLNS